MSASLVLLTECPVCRYDGEHAVIADDPVTVECGECQARFIVCTDGEQDRPNPVSEVSPGIRCKAGSRHTDFDGHVYVRVIGGVTYWVEVVQCKCLTWRTTKFYPNTGIMADTRRYWRASNADWPDDLSQEECRRRVLQSMLTAEEQ